MVGVPRGTAVRPKRTIGRGGLTPPLQGHKTRWRRCQPRVPRLVGRSMWNRRRRTASPLRSIALWSQAPPPLRRAMLVRRHQPRSPRLLPGHPWHPRVPGPPRHSRFRGPRTRRRRLTRRGTRLLEPRRRAPTPLQGQKARRPSCPPRVPRLVGRSTWNRRRRTRTPLRLRLLTQWALPPVTLMRQMLTASTFPPSPWEATSAGYLGPRSSSPLAPPPMRGSTWNPECVWRRGAMRPKMKAIRPGWASTTWHLPVRHMQVPGVQDPWRNQVEPRPRTRSPSSSRRAGSPAPPLRRPLHQRVPISLGETTPSR